MIILAELPDLLTDVLGSQWSVVGIGLAFFALQLYLCLRFYYRMQRHERELAKLLGDMDDLELFALDFPWLKWVEANFPRGSTTPANFNRDDVLRELDTRLASDRHYMLLQRLGVMAPLLGVILTVGGFVALTRSGALDSGATAQQSLGDILYTVVPLVAGVGTGALLAFINQWLLHFAGGKVEAVRTAARAWFDAAIWSHIGLDTQAATVKSITAMEKMARTVTQSAELQEQNAAVLRESSAGIHRAADVLQEACGTFGEHVRSLPETLHQLTAASQAAVATLHAIIPAGERAVAGLDGSVAAFRTAIDTQFIEAVRTHHSTTETLAESVSRINESSERLKLSSTDLQDSVSAHASSFKALNRSLQQQVLPAHEAFLATITHFNGQAEGVAEQLERLHSQVIASLEKITSLAPDVSEAVARFSRSSGAFSDAVQHRFAPGADSHARSSELMATSAHQLQQSVRGFADGQAAIEQILDAQGKLSRELSLVYGTLRQAVERLSETGRLLNESYESGVVPSQRSVSQAADSLADSTRRLASFVDKGLDPVTQRLAQLDEALSRFAAATKVIRDFAEVRKDVERLGAALGQAAAVADVVAALPERIQSIVEEVVARRQEELSSNSKGGLAGWFRRRAR